MTEKSPPVDRKPRVLIGTIEPGETATVAVDPPMPPSYEPRAASFEDAIQLVSWSPTTIVLHNPEKRRRRYVVVLTTPNLRLVEGIGRALLDRFRPKK